jgi:hypothetical protein
LSCPIHVAHAFETRTGQRARRKARVGFDVRCGQVVPLPSWQPDLATLYGLAQSNPAANLLFQTELRELGVLLRRERVSARRVSGYG